MLTLLSFIDGLGFDPFIRGALSVGVGVVVLFGSTYLLVGSNSGARVGGLISGGALFGWMFLMGIFWTAYGMGWVGDAPTWKLLAVHSGDLTTAEHPRVQELGLVLQNVTPQDGVTAEDPDEAQAQAVAYSREQADAFDGWRYISTSDPTRGEASSSASDLLIEAGVFESTNEFLPLSYGTFNTGGKPLLDPDIAEDDPDKNAWVETFTDAPARILHKIDTMTLHAVHTQELMIVQVQGVVEQAALPGQAPPVAQVDPDKPIQSVIMERDRGGPLPMLFGGLRFTPAMFTLFNGIMFALFCWLLHNRDVREREIRAAA